MTTSVTGGSIWSGSSGEWQARDLQIEDDTIRAVRAPGESRSADVLDLTGLKLSPGMIELQINGGWGIDLQHEPGRLWELGARLPAVGVTAFLPTLTSNGAIGMDEALAALAAGPPQGWAGAEPLGWHFEGPWLSPVKAGAHDVGALTSIPAVLDARLSPEHGVRLVTLAPELSGARAAIAELVDRGVRVSLGHTAASAAEARDGFGAGATMGTHLFNAMDGLHHREPGLALPLLLDGHWVGLIADGHHVAPDLVDLAWRLARDRIVLVSDAVALLGMTGDEVARLDDGTLAGSVIGLDRCVRNLMRFAGVGLGRALTAATAHPCAVLGLDDRHSVAAGQRADLVALDAAGNVQMTMVGGQVVFDVRQESGSDGAD